MNTQKLKIKGVSTNLPDNPDNYADQGKNKRNECKRQAEQEAQWPTIAISTAHLCWDSFFFSLSLTFALVFGDDRIPLL